MELKVITEIYSFAFCPRGIARLGKRWGTIGIEHLAVYQDINR